MVKITRLLPGESEEDVDAKDLGFDVVPTTPPGPAEAAARIGALYAQAKEQTGVTIPQLEPYLGSVPASASASE
jgi:hypothetical protein